MADSSTVVTGPARATALAATAAEAAAAQPGAVQRKGLPLRTKLAYAMGGSPDFYVLFDRLADPVYNVGLGLSPTQVSITRATTLLLDACSGLLFGWLSDNTRGRWGRRRPYLLIGSIASGVGLPFLFMARPGWGSTQIFLFVIVLAALYAPLIACYRTPYESLGAELTPDYDERTSVQSYKFVIQGLAKLPIALALWFATRPMFNDPTTGMPDVARGAVWAAAIAGGWLILSGVVTFAFVREPYYEKVHSQERVGFVRTFADVLQSRPQLLLLGTALTYAISTMLVATFGFYALNYHVFHGDMAAAAEIGGWSSVAAGIGTIAGVVAANGLARRIGKHRTLIAALALGLLASGASWWLYTPAHPALSIVCSGLNGFSAPCVWVVLPAMSADVIDHDELSSRKRREGAYTACFSWVMRVGMLLSSVLIGGPLLEVTGFDANLGGAQTPETILWIRGLFTGIPVTALLLALVFIHFYLLGPERMREIRAQLEQRRGTV